METYCDIKGRNESIWICTVHNRDKRWFQKGQDTPSVPKQDRFGKEVLLCSWRNFEEVLHFELVPNGHAISAKLYCQQLERKSLAKGLRKSFKQKYPALNNRKHPFMQQPNAKSHTARKTKDMFEELDDTNILPHPVYSPDCAPSGYGLFRSMQHFLRSRRFDSFDGIEETCQEFFDSKSAEWYFDQIRKLADRWQK